MLPLKQLCLSISIPFIFSFAGTSATADAARDANRLISLSNIREQFENTRNAQARMVVRTYAGIVATRSDLVLPRTIRQKITLCYEERYDWPIFEAGIVEILVNTFSEKELQLLVDFFRDRSVPPTEISAFRAIVAKAGTIQSRGAEYIFNTTEGCIDHGTQVVLDYLRTQQGLMSH